MKEKFQLRFVFLALNITSRVVEATKKFAECTVQTETVLYKYITMRNGMQVVVVIVAVCSSVVTELTKKEYEEKIVAVEKLQS